MGASSSEGLLGDGLRSTTLNPVVPEPEWAARIGPSFISQRAPPPRATGRSCGTFDIMTGKGAGDGSVASTARKEWIKMAGPLMLARFSILSCT